MHPPLPNLEPNPTSSKDTLSTHRQPARGRYSDPNTGTMEDRFEKVEMIKKRQNFSL